MSFSTAILLPILVSFLALVFLIKLNLTNESTKTGLLFRIFKQILNNEVEVQWSRLHISIVHDYLRSIFQICDKFLEPAYEDLFYFSFCYSKSGSSQEVRAIKARKMSSLSKNIRDVFKVPRLKEFDHDRIKKKYQLVQAFIVFLLQLLYHKPAELIVDGIDSLGKELRFLCTVCADIPLMMGAEEAQILLGEVEAIANEAGSLVHSLIFSDDQGLGKMDERLAAPLNQIDLSKTNVLNRLSSSTTPTCMITPKTSVKTAQRSRSHQVT